MIHMLNNNAGAKEIADIVLIGTPEQIAEAAKRSGNEADYLCDNCRKERMARVMASTFGYEAL